VEAGLNPELAYHEIIGKSEYFYYSTPYLYRFISGQLELILTMKCIYNWRTSGKPFF
jgi:hypothetical protein